MQTKTEKTDSNDDGDEVASDYAVQNNGVNKNKRIVRFRSSFRNTIFEVMRERGWIESENEADWEIQWMERDITYDVFDNSHLLADQVINHFRNDRELCRKHQLVRNLKKYKRQLMKEAKTDELSKMDFWPTSFVLPNEYALFVEEFKKYQESSNQSPAWIMKPACRSQGKGIFLFRKLSDINKWRSEPFQEPADAPTSATAVADEDEDDNPTEVYVAQKYISNPLLFGGRKFDIRLYVYVPSFHPLQAWLYRSGFCRFTSTRYSNLAADMNNNFIHLTNVAIQSSSQTYDASTGGKWELRHFKLYMISQFGIAAVDRAMLQIESLIIMSLLSVQPIMISDKHCFELYGYDILLDDDLKPWLLEINGSPSLTASTMNDNLLKKEMLHACLDLVDVEGELKGNESRVGGFDLIYKNGYIPHHFNTSSTFSYTSKLGCTIPSRQTSHIEYLPTSLCTPVEVEQKSKRSRSTSIKPRKASRSPSSTSRTRKSSAAAHGVAGNAVQVSGTEAVVSKASDSK